LILAVAGPSQRVGEKRVREKPEREVRRQAAGKGPRKCADLGKSWIS
jgi:hypothetical protein